MSSSNAQSPRQHLQLLPKDFIKHHRSNFFQYEEKLSPEPNQSTSPEWITLKVRIVGKPSTFERMNPWSNRPYISWVEDVSSRHWLQVWLGRCIRWSWQICLIPPWILWIWFRNGNEMAVHWPSKSSVQRKNKKMLMLQTRARQRAGGGFVQFFWITFIFWPWYFAEIIGFDEPFLELGPITYSILQGLPKRSLLREDSPIPNYWILGIYQVTWRHHEIHPK